MCILLPPPTTILFAYGTLIQYVRKFLLCLTLPHELSQGETVQVLRGHRDPVFCVNYNSTSTLIVSGCLDGDIIIWNAQKGGFCCIVGFVLFIYVNAGKAMKTLQAHLDYVTAVHFNRASTLIVSCALDGLMCASL